MSVYYDPLLAKLVARGEHREAARRRAIEALKRYPVLGIRTNIPFLIRVLESERFRAGDVDTAFLDGEGERLRRDATPRALVPAVAAAAFADGLPAGAARNAPASAGPQRVEPSDPWDRLRDWRLS